MSSKTICFVTALNALVLLNIVVLFHTFHRKYLSLSAESGGIGLA